MFASVRSFEARRLHRRPLIRPLVSGSIAAIAFIAITTMATYSPLCARTSPAIFAGVEHAMVPQAVKALGDPNRPPIIEIATTPFSTSPNAVYRRTSNSAARGLFAGAVLLLTALNIILFSHLSRVYGACSKASEPDSEDVQKLHG